MNKIFLIGNLTRDPELRTTTSGVSVCTFTIAVNRRFAGQSAWRALGETCQRYLAKGRKVAVVGELQARTYEAKDGSTQLSLDVSADEVEFLTPKGQQEGVGSPSPSAPRSQGTDLSGFTDIEEDELPF